MNTYDVTVQLTDRNQTPNVTVWTGVRRVVAKAEAQAMAKACLNVRCEPPVPKCEDLAIKVVSTALVPQETPTP